MNTFLNLVNFFIFPLKTEFIKYPPDTHKFTCLVFFWSQLRIFKTISPNKTYSGFAASLIFGVFWFSILSISFSNYNIFGYLIVGFLIVLSSISGDLLLSFLKRKVDLKDSGSFLPGHGGLFDRADSILSVFFLLLLFIHITLLYL